MKGAQHSGIIGDGRSGAVTLCDQGPRGRDSEHGGQGSHRQKQRDCACWDGLLSPFVCVCIQPAALPECVRSL